MKEQIRRVIFTPYRGPASKDYPAFTLTMYATDRFDGRNGYYIAYKLTATQHARPIFEGEDFSCSPMDAIDSDASVRALMGFLTLRPGDTDEEYFERYTPEQLAFAETHAESLDAEVHARFGDD
jgi:hypothetical protein